MFRTLAARIVPRACCLPIASHNRHVNRPMMPAMNVVATHVNFVRAKHTTSGIQGNRNSKQKALAKKRIDSDEDDDLMALLDDSKDDGSDLHDM